MSFWRFMGLLLPHFYYLPPNFAELTVNLIKNFGIYIPHICIISVFKHTHTYMQKYQQAKVIFNVIPIFLTEKAVAPHSSTLAWKIPWMEEPGRLQSMGSLRVRHD